MYCDARVNAGVSEEVANLVQAHLDCELSTDEFDRLNEILRSCDAARTYFVEQARMHIHLHHLLSQCA